AELEADRDIPATVQQAEEVQLSDADLSLFGESPAINGVSSSPVMDDVPTDMADLIAAPTDAELSDLRGETRTQFEASEPTVSSVIDGMEHQIEGEVLVVTGGSTPDVGRGDDIKHIGQLEISLPLYTIYLAETDELARLLGTDFSEWRHEPSREVAVESLHAAHSLGGSSATVGFMVLHDIAHALERALMYLSRHPVVLTEHQFDGLDQCVIRMKWMLQQFALGEMPDAEPDQVRLLEQMLADVTARAEQAWDGAQTDLSSANLELDASSGVTPDLNLSKPSGSDVDSAAEVSVATPIVQVTTGTLVGPSTPLLVGSRLETEQPVSREHDDHTVVMRDDLDTDLLPIFVEEGRDLFPQLGQSLRFWQQTPTQTAAAQPILRILHTLKGSARMAGAMRLGQHLHGMESYVEHLTRGEAPTSADLEQLMAHHDAGLQLFEALQDPQAVPASAANAATNVGMESNAVESAQSIELPVLMPIMQRGFGAPAGQVLAAAQIPVSSVPLVRVRADILDRLVNQAGEVSISRSRIETEVSTLQQSLGELTENVSRLRSQLREIEMQAETQMASQLTQSGDREFDPLEFDRFTRLQELT
ncbi:MAG: Hpt domain-containing protein, partial [Herbaspirillum sp.]